MDADQLRGLRERARRLSQTTGENQAESKPVSIADASVEEEISNEVKTEKNRPDVASINGAAKVDGGGSGAAKENYHLNGGDGQETDPSTRSESESEAPTDIEQEWMGVDEWLKNSKASERGESEASAGVRENGRVENHQEYTHSNGPPPQSQSKFEEREYVKPIEAKRSQSPPSDALTIVPPNDLNAEMSVLGAILLNPDSIEEVKSLVPVDFYRPSHGMIFAAMQACWRDGQGIDAVTLTYELRQRGQINDTGGSGYIAELAAYVPTSKHIQSYASIVRELALKRRVASQAQALVRMALNGASAELVLEKARAISELSISESSARYSVICEDQEQAVAINAEYLARPEIIERLGYSQSIALMIGAKHHGKTTNVRTLALSVMRGLPIWGRATAGGPVVYVASDDEVASTRNELLRMGWNSKHDPLTFARLDPESDALPEQILEDIGELALKHRAVLIILDMLFDFVGIKDELSYAGTREAIGFVQKLADQTKCLVVGSHHTPKYLTDVHTAANAALGSQGISARFSPIILTRKWTDTLFTVESTTTRDPRGLELKPHKIIKNADGWIETTVEFKEWMKWEIYAQRVLDLFDPERPELGYDVYEAAERLDMDRARVQNVFKQLVTEKKLIRERRGRKYSYYLAGSDMFSREGGEFEAPAKPAAVSPQPSPKRLWGDEGEEFDENGMLKGW